MTDYRLYLPSGRDFVTYNMKLSNPTVKEVINNVCKTFGLDAFDIDNLSLVLTATPSNSGRVLDNSVHMKDIPQTEILGIYEKPHLTAVLLGDERGNLTARKILLDHKAPLASILPTLYRCFRVKVPVEHGFFLTDNPENIQFGHGDWLCANRPLINYAYNETKLLGVFPVSMCKFFQKSLIDSRTLKTGFLMKQSSTKWIERGPSAPPIADNIDLEIYQIRKKRGYWTLVPPYLYGYKNEMDREPIEIIALDRFIMHLKSDGLGHRIFFSRFINNMEGVHQKQNVVNYYALSADEDFGKSTGDLEEWFEALSPYCMNTGANKVFGVPLMEVVGKQPLKSSIPSILSTTIRFLDVYGLDMEGIFRLSGNLQLISYYKDLCDIGESPTLDDLKDPHTAASLLKHYLRELPEPIMMFDMYTPCLEIVSPNNHSSQQAKINKLIGLVYNLPDVNFLVLKCLLSLLRRVSQFSDINKMTLANLATVFGPNILRPRHESIEPHIMFRETMAINEITQMLIENEALILPREDTTTSSNTTTTASTTTTPSSTTTTASTTSSSSTTTNVKRPQQERSKQLVSWNTAVKSNTVTPQKSRAIGGGGTMGSTWQGNSSSLNTSGNTCQSSSSSVNTNTLPKSTGSTRGGGGALATTPRGTPPPIAKQFSSPSLKFKDTVVNHKTVLTMEELTEKVLHLEKELEIERQERKELSALVNQLQLRLQLITEDKY